MVAESLGYDSLSPQIQRRLGVLNYLLTQLYDSRAAYPDAQGLPEPSALGGRVVLGSSPGASPRQRLNSTGEAASLAAAAGDGLADALDPRVSVLDALAALPKADQEREPAESAVPPQRPSWGELAAAAASSGVLQQPASVSAVQGLELRLIDQLLPLLHDALAALCEFHVQLEQDEELRRQDKPPLLGEELCKRFDPLVWLAQYLMRQGGAVKAFDKAMREQTDESPSSLEAAALQLRGEHLCTKELPLYTAIRAAVFEEAGWRSLPLLKPMARRVFDEAADCLRNSKNAESPSSPKAAPIEGIPTEDLPLLLGKLDEAWNLDPECGFSGAVLGSGGLLEAALEKDLSEDEEGGAPEEQSSLSSDSNGGGDGTEFVEQKRETPASHPKQTSQQPQRLCLGECMNVQLEVANEERISFEEFWRFLFTCIDTSRNLRHSVFAFARVQLSSSNSVGGEKGTGEKPSLEKSCDNPKTASH